MKENINNVYSTYFQDVYRFLLSLSQNLHTAEDLVQETFVRAHLYIENYKGEHVKTWLFTIAHHVLRAKILFASFFLWFIFVNQ